MNCKQSTFWPSLAILLLIVIVLLVSHQGKPPAPPTTWPVGADAPIVIDPFSDNLPAELHLKVGQQLLLVCDPTSVNGIDLTKPGAPKVDMGTTFAVAGPLRRLPVDRVYLVPGKSKHCVVAAYEAFSVGSGRFSRWQETGGYINNLLRLFRGKQWQSGVRRTTVTLTVSG